MPRRRDMWHGEPCPYIEALAPMNIRIDSLLEGAHRAEGTAVIVDVFRAFTTAAVAFSRGVRKIVMVAEVAEALRLREEGIGDVCAGEVNGIRPDGFDFGNSPHEVSQADLAGKTLIQSTRAGTVGIAAARKAERIYAASLVVASATARAIREENPALVSIVAMGSNATTRADEDEQCAMLIRNLAEGRHPDPECVRRLILESPHAAKFGDPMQPHFHPRDRAIALDVDRFDFAIRVGREDGLLVARAVTIPETQE